MSLMDEAQQIIRAYIAGRIGLGPVQDWLSQHAQAVADARDEQVEELYGRASILLAELGYGHRSEAEVRNELSALLGTAQVAFTAWTNPQLTQSSAQLHPFVIGFEERATGWLPSSVPAQRSPVVA